MRSSPAHDIRWWTGREGNIRPVIAACKIIVESLFLSPRTRVIAENARPSSTESVPADRRVYEGHGDWTEGRLVLMANRSWQIPGRIHSAPAVAKMVGTRNCGTFTGYRCSQWRQHAWIDTSEGRRWRPRKARVPKFCSMCKTPWMLPYRSGPFAVDWLLVACAPGVH